MLVYLHTDWTEIVYVLLFYWRMTSIVFMSAIVNYDILHIVVFLSGKPARTHMLWIFFFSLFISVKDF